MSINVSGVAINFTSANPLFGEILAIYNTRQAAIAQANAIKSAQTLGTNLGVTQGLQNYSTSPRTLTLELLTPQSKAATNASPGAPSGYFLSTSLTFAVAKDGYAQNISITATARQNVHQTVVGNYVDEWGMAPGQLTVDCDVIWTEAPPSQVQSFFDLIQNAKATTPLSDELPSILRYHDDYLNRSYVITQDSLVLTESADHQNMGHLTIAATILYDYGLASFPLGSSTSQTPIPNASMQAALTTGLQTFGTAGDAGGG